MLFTSLFYPFVDGGFISCLRLTWESIKLSNQWTCFYMREFWSPPFQNHKRKTKPIIKHLFSMCYLTKIRLIVMYLCTGLPQIHDCVELGSSSAGVDAAQDSACSPHQFTFLNQKMYLRGPLTCFSWPVAFLWLKFCCSLRVEYVSQKCGFKLLLKCHHICL